MSAPAGPFNRGEVTPQSIQKILDENAQLIRALVENMNIRGKSMECIQYQQILHRNLVYLASLADPSLNLQSVLPLPGTNFTRAVSSQSQTSSASAHYSIPPHSASTQQQRQPQAPPLSVAMTTTSALTSEGQWSSVQSMKQPLPPVPPYVKGYSGMWGGQPTPYGMQRPMDSGGGGARPGLPIDMGREERKRQLLRMQQEQMIQAQQARRMQQQQQQMVGHTPMYPPPPGQPPPGMMPMGQGGMPPGYSQGSSLPTHTMPPGHMNM